MDGSYRFQLNVDTKLSEAGLAGMRLANAVKKPQFKKIIRSEIAEAKKIVKARARQEVKGRDPRKAALGIRSVSYTRELGGKIDIFEPRNKVYRMDYRKPRKPRPEWARGGNRMKRSMKTKRMDSYYGQSRAFVLRFLNSGTMLRKTANGANRGVTWGSGWFETSATIAMRKAAERIGSRIAEQVIKEYEK